MCGIFGAVGLTDSNQLSIAARTLAHRGPDGFGEWREPDGDAYLAHCRLAIVDLSDCGRQPMTNEDGSLQLSFNGEIYNFEELRSELLARGHVFRSRTDSEVLLHGYEEWGPNLVKRLRGMFAFAIWDARHRRWFLARDRLGIKPLVYALNGRSFVFASEARAIIQALPERRRIAPMAALQLLRRSYVAGNGTIWEGIWRLPPGTTAVYSADEGTLKVNRYWRPLSDCEINTDEREAVDRFDHLMKDAVGEELMGDVPVGVFLSGGLDSSLIASYASEIREKVPSFFVDFSGWPGSERDDASMVAEALGTQHRVSTIESGVGALNDASERRDFFSAFDEPVGDPSGYPTWLLCREISRSVKVALSGDGGDEIFGGYQWYAQIMPFARRQLAWSVESLRRHFKLGREWPGGCASSLEFYHLLHCPSFTDSELLQLFPQWREFVVQAWMVDRQEIPRNSPHRDEQLEWQLRDLSTYLVDNNLARVDRASMAHGLEVRVPLLDHRIVDFGLSLPPKLRSTLAGGKLLMRQVAEERLPGHIARKQKQGFSVPLTRLIDFRRVEGDLARGTLVREGLMSAVGLAAWLDRPREHNHALKLWLLFVLEGWAEHWCFPRLPGAFTPMQKVRDAA